MSNWGVVPRIGPGLCATCGHVDTVRSDRGSVFLRCRLSDVDPRFPKYPTLPVVECIGWASGSDNQPAEHRSNDHLVTQSAATDRFSPNTKISSKFFAARIAASLLGYSPHIDGQRPPDVEGPDRRLAAGRQHVVAFIGHPVSEDRLVGQVNPALRLGIVRPIAPRARHQLFLYRFSLKDRLFFLCNRWFRNYHPGGTGGTFPAPHPVDGLPDGLDLDAECVGGSLVCQFRLGGAQGNDRCRGRGLAPTLRCPVGGANLGHPISTLLLLAH